MAIGEIAEAVLRRDRALVFGALALVTAIAWAYTFLGVGMPEMKGGTMGMTADEHALMLRHMAWTPVYALLMFLMWWIMMIAMMVPSAAPMVLFFAAIDRKASESSSPALRTASFLSGYLFVWGGFSLLATLAQWGLDRTGLLGHDMRTANAALGGATLLAAGLYQLTPVKQACLSHCRQPLTFITRHWRTGSAGALRMGVWHGAYCLGCCWFLMALLFVGGVMNMVWVAGIAAYVFIEKATFYGHWLSYATGLALVAGGIGFWVSAT